MMSENLGEDFVKRQLGEMPPDMGKTEITIRWLGFARSPIVLFGISPIKPFGVTFWFWAWGLCVGPHWVIRIKRPANRG